MIRIEDLSITLGDFDLREINLEIRRGEYFVLLGPTGAGKTVLVECVAGLHRPRSGRLLVQRNGLWQDITNAPPERRGIGYVPQDYSLFPNMTVKENMAFGLRTRGWSRTQIDLRVKELASWLGIGHLLDRYPLNLSGGEKQRVALARALAVFPDLLLLDEPLAAVDEETRERLADDLKRIQKESGATFLHVSHNFEETRHVAERVAVMQFLPDGNRRVGRIVQVGSIEEVFERPLTKFVARFTGAGNVWDAKVESTDRSASLVSVGGLRLVVWSPVPRPPVSVVIRPENVRLSYRPPSGNLVNAFPATVDKVADKGSVWSVILQTQTGLSIQAHMAKGNGWLPQIGATTVWVHLPPEHLHLCWGEPGT